MDLTKKFEELSKKQRKLLKNLPLGLSDYKADLQSQLIASPPPDQEKKFWIENMLRLIDEKERNPQPDSGWWKGTVKVILILFGPLMLVWLAMTIDKSDIFQRIVNPQKYWRTQVAILEQHIHDTKLYIKDWEDYSQGKNNSFSIDYDSLVRAQIIEGKEPEEAKRIASNQMKEMDKVNKETYAMILKMQRGMLETSYKSLDNYKRQLDQARNELSKYH